MNTTILVFKTDIISQTTIRYISSIFRNYPIIMDWSVDMEDIDHVLRIEAVGDLTEREVIRLMHQYGFQCEPLVD